MSGGGAHAVGERGGRGVHDTYALALLCLSKVPERTARVAAHFRAVLGQHADGRIRGGVSGA